MKFRIVKLHTEQYCLYSYFIEYKETPFTPWKKVPLIIFDDEGQVVVTDMIIRNPTDANIVKQGYEDFYRIFRGWNIYPVFHLNNKFNHIQDQALSGEKQLIYSNFPIDYINSDNIKQKRFNSLKEVLTDIGSYLPTKLKVKFYD